MKTEQQFLTVSEAANMLKVTPVRVHQLIHAGVLGASWFGRARQVLLSDVKKRLKFPVAAGSGTKRKKTA